MYCFNSYIRYLSLGIIKMKMLFIVNKKVTETMDLFNMYYLYSSIKCINNNVILLLFIKNNKINC